MEILVFCAIIITFQFFWTMVIRQFPEIVGKGIVTRIQHAFNRDLEKLKGQIRENEIMIKSSIDFVSSQSEYRLKVISSVETIWLSIRNCQDFFSGLITAHNLLLPNELDQYFKSERKTEGIDTWLSKFKQLDFFNEYQDKNNKRIEGTEILYVGSQLWLYYDSIIRIHLRLAWLVNQSFENGKYLDWRSDKFMWTIMEEVMDKRRIEKAATRKLGGINEILRYLVAEFISEASNVIRGSKELEHSIPVIQTVLKNEASFDHVN